MFGRCFNNNTTKSAVAAARLDRGNHILTAKTVQNPTVLNISTRLKSDIVAVKFKTNVHFNVPKGVTIKNLYGNLIIPKPDLHHIQLWNKKTETIDKVATSAPEYPLGTPNVCLNPNTQLNGTEKAQYIAETQVQIHAPKDTVIIDKERTKVLHNEANRHKLAHTIKTSSDIQKPKVSASLKTEEAMKKNKED